MGRIGTVLSSVFGLKGKAKVTRIKGDTGGGASKLNDMYQPIGEDSKPLPGDKGYFAETEKQGGYVVIGFNDPNNSQKAADGEKRLYARDSSGAEVVEFWLKSDGSAALSNENGQVSLSSTGSITAENNEAELRIKPNGGIVAENSAGGSIELKAAGNAVINTVIIDLAGNITTGGIVTASSFVGGSASIAAVSVGSISIGGVDLPAGHTHSYTWTDPAGSGETDAPTP